MRLSERLRSSLPSSLASGVPDASGTLGGPGSSGASVSPNGSRRASDAPSGLPPSGRLRVGPEPPGRLWSPGARGARVLVSAGVLAVLVALLFLWLARPRTAADPAPGRDAPAAALVSGPGASAPVGPATPSSSGSTVLVHVLGKVRHPGVVTLPAGARVADALRAAGGPRPGAGTGPLNLARPVVDGEQIPVGVPGASPIPPPAPGAVPGSGPAGGTDSAPIDLNTATSDDLQRLPGVGPVLAERILAYRTQHGGFRSVDQLREVSGIGERRFADLRQRVRT